MYKDKTVQGCYISLESKKFLDEEAEKRGGMKPTRLASELLEEAIENMKKSKKKEKE